MIRILIVEDMILLQESLANTINGQEDMEVVGVTADADEALALCRNLAPDLALIDVVTENKVNGIAAAAAIRREMPQVKIVIMTALPEISFPDAARQAGAHSFVYKDSTSRHVLYVIRCTMQGQGMYPGPGDATLAKIRFSDAEIAVIRLVCRGHTLHEITKALSLSEDRIKELISGILDKTGFDSITKFSIHAVAGGYVVPDGGDGRPPAMQDAPDGPQSASSKACPEEIEDLMEFLAAGDEYLMEFLAAGDREQPVPDADMSAFYAFRQNIAKLSKAEDAVFNLYIEGHSAAEIAEKLFVSINTVKSHNKNIYRKLNVSSLKEMMVYAQMMKKQPAPPR